MANIAIFRINYKSDFILTLNSDAGWMTPFCIKFWTGAPSQAYFASFDGTTYTHCAPVEGEPTKLQVQFDDHHLPIGDLQFQIGYHFTVDDFPTSVEDEVLNQASVIIEVDDVPAQVMLDLNGETAPEIEFSLPAYANEAQRIANEQERIAAEEARIQNEETRISAEQARQTNETQRIEREQARQTNEAQRIEREQARQTNEEQRIEREQARQTNETQRIEREQARQTNEEQRIEREQARQSNEEQRIANETERVTEFAEIKTEAVAATNAANTAASLANEKADYAQAQGDYAKEQGDTALADHERAEADHTTAAADHTQAVADHTQAASDHTRAEEDHSTASADHTTATSDHTQAGQDHTTAASDHTQAEQDHTQAEQDHTRAESDHTRAESDHEAVEVYVDSLGAFDISAYHATGGVLAKYADLTAALGTEGANIPDALRKGGMSVKFVQSSDNKYIQARCMAQNFTTDVTQWQGVDGNPTSGSNNLVMSGGVYSAIPEVVNSLNSSATDKALSAAQGKVLADLENETSSIATSNQQKINQINSVIQELDGSSLNICDPDGNTIATFDSNGLKTTKIEAEDGDVNELGVGNVTAGGDGIIISDNNGYIIAKINKEGLSAKFDYSTLPYSEIMTDLGHTLKFNNGKCAYQLKNGVVYRVKAKGTMSADISVYSNQYMSNALFTIGTAYGASQFVSDGDYKYLYSSTAQEIDITPITLTTAKNEYRYLVATFNSGSTYSPYGLTFNNTKGLWLMGTNDLRKFSTIGYVYKPTKAANLRDPSICLVDGWYHIIYTIEELTSTEGVSFQRYLGHAKTRDFITWHESDLISVDYNDFGLTENNIALWAPQYCWDVKTGKYIVSVSVMRYESDGTFTGITMAAYDFDFDSDTLGSLIVQFSARYDTQIIWHNGYYYYFSVAGYIYKSEQLGVGLTQCKNLSDGIMVAEAPFVIRLDDGRFRWFMQGLTYNGQDDHRMYYYDSLTSDIEGNWSDRNVINFTETIRNESYVEGYPAGYPSHWTIFDFNNKIV